MTALGQCAHSRRGLQGSLHVSMRAQPARGNAGATRTRRLARLFDRLAAASQWGEGVSQDKAQGGGGCGQELRRGAGPGLPCCCASREALWSFQDAGCWQALLTSPIALVANLNARHVPGLCLLWQYTSSCLENSTLSEASASRLPSESRPRRMLLVSGDLFFHFCIKSILCARIYGPGQVRLRNRDLPPCQRPSHATPNTFKSGVTR